jgi:hypothetical protein
MTGVAVRSGLSSGERSRSRSPGGLAPAPGERPAAIAQSKFTTRLSDNAVNENLTTLRPSHLLTVRPHLERGGYHVDRFDAYLDGELVVTSRQPLLDGARALLDQGHPPQTRLTIRHHGRDHDSFAPRSIGELAKWTIKERDKGGLSRERWSAFSDQDRAGSSPVASPAAEAA